MVKFDFKNLYLPSCFWNWYKMCWFNSFQKQSSRGVFYKKVVLRNFVKFTGKHLWYKPCSFFKKETLTQVLSCEFCKISKNNFFIELFWWLLLSFMTEVSIIDKPVHWFALQMYLWHEWINKKVVICYAFSVFKQKSLNKNRISPKQIMALCCVVNFKQFCHINIMLSLNILFFV